MQGAHMGLITKAMLKCPAIGTVLLPYCYVIFIEATLLCLLLNKLHFLIQIVPLHVCYMFRPVLKPSSAMSIHRSCKRKHNTS
jgi:hypothetical protein